MDDVPKRDGRVDLSLSSLSLDPVRERGAATFVLRGALLGDYLNSEEVIDVDIRYQSVPVYRDVLKLLRRSVPTTTLSLSLSLSLPSMERRS